MGEQDGFALKFDLELWFRILFRIIVREQSHNFRGRFPTFAVPSNRERIATFGASKALTRGVRKHSSGVRESIEL
jgi:hypothetical protein